MYTLYIYDVLKDYCKLIKEMISEEDIPNIKQKYGSTSVVIDGTDILVLRTRL